MERRYRTKAVEEDSLMDEERTLMAHHHLSLAQIGFRRKIQANFRAMARQEFAEDAESAWRSLVSRGLVIRGRAPPETPSGPAAG